MAIPLLKKKVIKKRVKQFKRHQSDRRITVKELITLTAHSIVIRLRNPRFIVSANIFVHNSIPDFDSIKGK